MSKKDETMILVTPFDGSKLVVIENNPKYIFVTSEKQIEELNKRLRRRYR